MKYLVSRVELNVVDIKNTNPKAFKHTMVLEINGLILDISGGKNKRAKRKIHITKILLETKLQHKWEMSGRGGWYRGFI